MMESDCSNEEIDIISSGQNNEPETLENGSLLQQASTARFMESPRPGPSGINQSYENEDIQVDSDDSIKIIDIPKKPVPMIILSDSNSESEIDVIEVDSKPTKSRVKSIKERLEEQKSKIFAVKVEAGSGGESPSNKYDVTCSICLGTYQNRAFLDECFHSFCYTCILQWAKVVHTCPLCKTGFKSIIHNITPDLGYKQDFMNKPSNQTTELSSLGTFHPWEDTGQRFRYRTTLTSVGNYISDWYRQRRYESFRTSTSVPYRRRHQRRSWGRRQPSSPGHMTVGEERRRSVYRCGLVIKEIRHPPGRVKYRDISVQFFKQNPAISHRLVPWILRDLKVLLGYNSSDASFVLHLIMSLLQRYPMDSNEFYNQLQPYLYDNTRQFILELISFASSPYDMQTYDTRVVHDIQPTMQSIVTNTAPRSASVLQSQTYADFECEITFRDRLLDEMFDESRNGTSPPYNHPLSPSRHQGSPTYRPSSAHGDRDTLEDQGWDSCDSLVDVTGTNSPSRTRYNVDLTSDLEVQSERDVNHQEKGSQMGSGKETEQNKVNNGRSIGRQSGISETGSAAEAHSVLSRANGSSTGHMPYSADNVCSRRFPSGLKPSSGSRSSINVSCAQEDSVMESDTQSSTRQRLSSKSSDSSRLQKEPKSPEKYRKSRRSTSRSKQTNNNAESMRSSGKERNHSHRKPYSGSTSYGDISRSRSNRRSRSRSRDSSRFYDITETRAGKERERSRRRWSSRSRSKESPTGLKESKSRKLRKTEDAKSSRDFIGHSHSSRKAPKKAKERYRSAVDVSFTEETTYLADRPRSRSREDKRRSFRSGSRESSGSSIPSRSIKAGEEYRSRSSKSKSKRSRLSRSKSRNRHKSKSRTSKRYNDSGSSTSRSRDSSSYSGSRLLKPKGKHKSRKHKSRKHHRRDLYKERPKSREASDSETYHRNGDVSKGIKTIMLIDEKLNGKGTKREDNQGLDSSEGIRKAMTYASAEHLSTNTDENLQQSRQLNKYGDSVTATKHGVAVSGAKEQNEFEFRPTIEGGRSWNRSENRSRDVKVVGIDDGNDYKNDVGDRTKTASQSTVDHASALGHQNELHLSSAVRARSPEYNPVKISSPNKSKIVKLKRRPFGAKIVGSIDRSCEAANGRKFAIKSCERDGGPTDLLNEHSRNMDKGDDSITAHGIETCEGTSTGPRLLERELNISERTKTTSLKQIANSSANKHLGITGQNQDNVMSSTSGTIDVGAWRVECIAPIIDNVDKGTDSLHVADGNMDIALIADVHSAKNCLSTVSTDRIASISSSDAISATVCDRNYSSTIDVISSLDDREIAANIRELNQRISTSKEVLKDL